VNLQENIRRILREIEEDKIQIRLGRSAERHFGKVQNIIIMVDDQDITSEDDVPGLGKMNIVIKDNEIIVGDIFIPEKYRKQGIATIVYQKISDYFNLPIVNSKTKGFNQTIEGGHIWKKRERFRPYNKMNLQEQIKKVLKEEINESNFLYKAKDLIGRLLLKDKYNAKPSLSFDREFGTEISQKYNYPFGLSENKIWRVINNCSDGSEKNCILVKKIVDKLGDYFPYPDYSNLPFEKKVDILQGMVSNFNYDDIVSFSIEGKTGENNELEDEVDKLQNKLNYIFRWVPSKQTIDKIKKSMNLQEQIRKVLREELLNETKFFLRRINDLDEIKNLLSINADQTYNETKSYDQFKYELTLRVVESIIWNRYGIGWEDLPEQEEIDYVTQVSNTFDKRIKQLYKEVQTYYNKHK